MEIKITDFIHLSEIPLCKCCGSISIKHNKCSNCGTRASREQIEQMDKLEKKIKDFIGGILRKTEKKLE